MALARSLGETPELPLPGLVRSPLNQWLLVIVTLGIYLVVHHWTINRELRDFGVEVDPTRATLAVFPGGLVVVPYLVTVHRTGARIGVAQETVGLTPSIRPGLGTVAAMFAAAQIPYLQSELNQVWRAEHEQAKHKESTHDRSGNPGDAGRTGAHSLPGRPTG